MSKKLKRCKHCGEADRPLNEIDVCDICHYFISMDPKLKYKYDEDYH